MPGLPCALIQACVPYVIHASWSLYGICLELRTSEIIWEVAAWKDAVCRVQSNLPRRPIYYFSASARSGCLSLHVEYFKSCQKGIVHPARLSPVMGDKPLSSSPPLRTFARQKSFLTHTTEEKRRNIWVRRHHLGTTLSPHDLPEAEKCELRGHHLGTTPLTPDLLEAYKCQGAKASPRGATSYTHDLPEAEKCKGAKASPRSYILHPRPVRSGKNVRVRRHHL